MIESRDLSIAPHAIRERGETVDKYLNETLVSLFSKTAETNPHAIAVSYHSQEITYSELHARSSQLANHLAKIAGTRTPLIGLCMKRSVEMMIAILGILKAGRGYVPIDPDAPVERNHFILSDTNVELLIIDPDSAENKIYHFDGIHQFSMTDLWTEISHYSRDSKNDICPSSPAYVIYTSGSTGNPKGVLVNHIGVVNHMAWLKDLFSLTCSDIVLQKTTHIFDVSAWEIFLTLCFGARLVICDQTTSYDPNGLVRLIEKKSVSTIHFVPTMFQSFVTALRSNNIELPNSIRHVVSGGEALSASLVSSYFLIASIPLYNLYGPTEVSITASFQRILPTHSIVPIGKPLWNTTLYVVDENGTIVKDDRSGELLIGGVGVAVGYLNRPELTHEKFILNPFEPGRLYRTGDVCHWLNDVLIFQGRNDEQVKIRGHRIELGEIEHVLQLHPAVQHCAVLVDQQEEDDKHLVAYLKLRRECRLSELHTHLLNKLPKYMIPSRFFFLAEFPRTATGKTDRIALHLQPKIILNESELSDDNDLTTEERLLIEIFKRVLRIEDISVNDDFFILGGHSLRAIKICNELKLAGYTLSVEAIFKTPCISQLANYLEKTELDFPQIIPSEEQYFYTPSDRQLQIFHAAKDQPLFSRCDAFILNDIKIDLLLEAINIVIRQYENLRSGFINSDFGLRLKISGFDEIQEVIEHVELPQIESTAPEIVHLIRKRQHEMTLDPMFMPYRILIISTGDGCTIFAFFVHHILFDETSQQKFYQAILINYNDLLKESHNQKIIPIQFKDFLRWRSGVKQISHRKKSKRYWLKVFGKPIPLLNLSFKNINNTEIDNGIVGSFSLTLGRSLIEDLSKLSVKSHSTLSICMMTSVYILLVHQSTQNDICILTPVAGRILPELDDQLGLYANVLPLRFSVPPSSSISDAMRHIKSVLLEAMENQDYPIELIIQDSKVDNSQIKIAIIFEDVDVSFGGESVQVIDLQIHPEKNACELNFVFNFSMTSLRVVYDESVFTKKAIEALLFDFQAILMALIENPQLPIGHLLLPTR